jgi:Raf kinase inhibitor-like YbhB/YbcL family protein
MSRMVRTAVGMVFGVAVHGSAQTTNFTLSSTDAHAGAQMAQAQAFNGMGCTGKNMSPELEWKGAPATAKSFAVTVYDPDAPTGSGWWHWVAYNIPATTKKLVAGAGAAASTTMPAGAKQGNTDFGTPGYGGACPPEGDAPHHYIFTVYALDVASLDLPATATAAYVSFNLHAHTVAKATFTALYKRP